MILEVFLDGDESTPASHDELGGRDEEQPTNDAEQNKEYEGDKETVNHENKEGRSDEETVSSIENGNTNSPVSLSEEQFAELPEELDDDFPDPNENSFTNLVNDADEWSEWGCSNPQSGVTETQAEASPARDKYCCYICNFWTTCSKDFSDHILGSHNKLCPHCEFSTTTEDLLKKHLRTHTSNLECDQCDFQTANELVLKDHKLKKHEETQPSENLSDVAVNVLLSKNNSRKRKNTENGSSLSKEKEKSIRIDKNKRATSPDMFESENDSDFSQNEDENKNQASAIETNLFKHHEHDVTALNNEQINCLDENNGNVAYIIKNYPSSKKPISDRKVINWGTSQSQRGKTTFYPCAGYFECEKCEKKAKTEKICKSCNIPLTHKSCGAKKYVYFCQNKCVREMYRDCCDEEPNDKKLVVLFVGKHNCIAVNQLKENQSLSKYKPVKTTEDILANLARCLDTDSEEYSVEVVTKVPSDINGKKYFVLETKENCELKEIIREATHKKTAKVGIVPTRLTTPLPQKF